MDELNNSLLSLEEKSNNTYKEMNDLINSIENIITETNKELDNDENKDDNLTKEILNKKEKELKKLKTVPKLNKVCNNYYHKLKEVNEKINSNIEDKKFLDNENLKKFVGKIDEKIINDMIIEHLIRKGNVNTVKKFIEEKKLKYSSDNDINLFQEYYLILNEIKEKKLDKLLEWCEKNKNTLLKNLTKKKNNIYFECIKFDYILYLEDSSKSVEDCVNFSRKYFKPFISNKLFITEISKLMSRLLFRKNDTYEKIDIPKYWENIKNLFIETFLKLNHKTKDDSLDTILLAGRFVLPQVFEAEEKLTKDKDKEKEKEKKEEGEKNQLMYSLELPEELIFHDIFVCPITKEISSLENQPIRLNCGHCICKTSFDKIEKTGTGHNQIKCPICTQVGKTTDVATVNIL